VGVVVGQEEGEDSAVRDNGQGIIRVLGEQGVDGLAEAGAGLLGRFLTKYQFVRPFKQLDYGRFKLGLAVKVGRTLPVMFL
jgi:hypothetical protein